MRLVEVFGCQCRNVIINHNTGISLNQFIIYGFLVLPKMKPQIFLKVARASLRTLINFISKCFYSTSLVIQSIIRRERERDNRETRTID